MDKHYTHVHIPLLLIYIFFCLSRHKHFFPLLRLQQKYSSIKNNVAFIVLDHPATRSSHSIFGYKNRRITSIPNPTYPTLHLTTVGKIDKPFHTPRTLNLFNFITIFVCTGSSLPATPRTLYSFYFFYKFLFVLIPPVQQTICQTGNNNTAPSFLLH